MKFQLVYIKVCFWRCNERFKKVGVVSSAINRVIGTDIKWEGMKKISLNEIVSILKGGNFTKKIKNERGESARSSKLVL